VGSICATLKRLEQKGHVTAELGDRHLSGVDVQAVFPADGCGSACVANTRSALTSLWTGVPLLEGGRS